MRMKLIFVTMITGISLFVNAYGHDEPKALNRNKYLVSSFDSSKVADSLSVNLKETEEYSRDDFNLLLEKFCTDKPISTEELIENRPFLK